MELWINYAVACVLLYSRILKYAHTLHATQHDEVQLIFNDEMRGLNLCLTLR